ncbi:spore gernimation protein GerPD [Aureibacillus halotolerans]|uniref:Spore germination protein PD n=1 Tax=Aureibacillus halotolerans TaxID=1508390 RepID=A0A4R6U8E8_9BACI|nr:spore gernimation protein GerPD [Aureibacillus halotolerans]TDQ42076.1 spore germination protein PD [Aureibacillus halotolerans]
MTFQVVNYELSTCQIDVTSVSASSLLLVGDAEVIALSSMFDTPPESLIIGPFVPLTTR